MGYNAEMVKSYGEVNIQIKRLSADRLRLCLYVKRKLIDKKEVTVYKPFDVLKKIEFILKYHRTSREVIW